MKMIQSPTMIQDLNALLPPQIRVWDIVRVTGSFHAKNACTGRRYEYMLPTYMLREAPTEERENVTKIRSREEMESIRSAFYAAKETAYKAKKESINTEEKQRKKTDDSEDEEDDAEDEEAVQADFQMDENVRLYRCSMERLNLFKQVLQQYEGAHNYHNYTIRRPYGDRSSWRNILSMTVRFKLVEFGFIIIVFRTIYSRTNGMGFHQNYRSILHATSNP
jgi:tRNA pseudouridine38-40 synthase